MTDTYVSYAPGSWTLVARAGCYLLVEAEPTAPAVSTLWTVMAEGDLGAILGAVAADLPGAGFCLVGVGSDGVRLAQHQVNALLNGRPIGAGTSAQIVDVPAEGGMIMAASAASAAQAQLPVEAGVVAAGALLVVQVAAEEPSAPALEPTPTEAPILEESPVADQGVAPSPSLWDDVPEFDETAQDLVPEPTVVSAVRTLADAPAPQVTPVAAVTTALPDGTVTGATVLAGYCLNGHISGAYAPTCRVCGEPMPPQTPRTVPRPSLGVLVLESGDTFDLETGAVLGRAPRVPDEALETPLLVSLAAYGRDISRQHAEVVVHGWNVFVRDLGSANGTRLRSPDGAVTTLDPDVPVPLAPDSVIEVADVTTVTYRIA